jgi:hypothetical protein
MKRDSPEDPEEVRLRPAEEAVGVAEAEARLARREATRALNARREAAAAFVVDVDAPNTEVFNYDTTQEVQVVAVQQTVHREQRREILSAESKDSEDDEDDEEKELSPRVYAKDDLTYEPVPYEPVPYEPTAYVPYEPTAYVPYEPTAYVPYEPTAYVPYEPTAYVQLPVPYDLAEMDGNSGFGESEEEL